MIDSEAALCIGLVNFVVNHEELMAKTNELAEKILSKAPVKLAILSAW